MGTFASFDTGKNYADWSFFEGVKKDSKVKFVLLEKDRKQGEDEFKLIATTFPEVKNNAVDQASVLMWLKGSSRYISSQWNIVQAAVDGKDPPAKSDEANPELPPETKDNPDDFETHTEKRAAEKIGGWRQ